ncbi:MAG: hypothetical protein IPO87_03695 [Flavobacteriales bacterium]|nr:hypothetical protein [Flavobacteriales bacterium]
MSSTITAGKNATKSLKEIAEARITMLPLVKALTKKREMLYRLNPSKPGSTIWPAHRINCLKPREYRSLRASFLNMH